MTRLAIHPGTGTVIDLDDGCWFIETESLPEDVDDVDSFLEEIASIEYKDIPEDIPAVRQLGFDYTVRDLNEDIDLGIFSGEHAEWLKAQPANEREFVIQSAFGILFDDNDFWNLWRDALKHSTFLYRKAEAGRQGVEPF